MNPENISEKRQKHHIMTSVKSFRKKKSMLEQGEGIWGEKFLENLELLCMSPLTKLFIYSRDIRRFAKLIISI